MTKDAKLVTLVTDSSISNVTYKNNDSSRSAGPQQEEGTGSRQNHDPWKPVRLESKYSVEENILLMTLMVKVGILWGVSMDLYCGLPISDPCFCVFRATIHDPVSTVSRS